MRESVTVQVLGGGLDVGRSCFLLTLGRRKILLDCGAHPGFADIERRFPKLASLPQLDLVLITHYHFDHAGALPLLRVVTSQPGHVHPPIAMTAPTRQLVMLMLQDFFVTSRSRDQFLPFDEYHVNHALDDVAEISLEHVWSPKAAPDVKVTAYYAGHALGAVMFRIQVSGSGSVVYTGDYSLTPDGYFRGAKIPVLESRPHLLITECTYCGSVRRSLRTTAESELHQSVLETLRNRGKVLIPVAALGRAQEMLVVLAALWKKECLEHVPVYVSAGLLSKASSIHDSFASQWLRKDMFDFSFEPSLRRTLATADGCIPSICRGDDATDQPSPTTDVILGESDTARSSGPRIHEFYRSRDWALISKEGPMILLATPGSLSGGISYDVFRVWSRDARNLVVVPGFCFSNSVAGRLLASSHSNADGIVEECRCKLINMSLSSHIDARGILRTIRRICPRAVMLVHGEENKIRQFYAVLERVLGGKIMLYSPANGTTVSLRSRTRFSSASECSRRRLMEKNDESTSDNLSCKGTPGNPTFTAATNSQQASGVAAEWLAAIAQYENGNGVRDKHKREAGHAICPVGDDISTISHS